MIINIPKGAKILIDRLNQAAHEAYIVGGCVRDSLLGQSPPDWDITTTARPAQISEIFKDFKQIGFGSRHGTIAVKPPECDIYYEITTYRIDGAYADGRRPDTVSFTCDLTEDLRRRDFTINAIAYSPTTGLIDPFNGHSDLENGIIRCVGDPAHRFAEDYLRIIRAYRFAAVLSFNGLNFTLEKNTRQAAINARHNLNKIARERIGAELSKLFAAKNHEPIEIFLNDIADTLLPEIAALKGLQQNTPYHIHDVYNHTLEVMRHTPPALHLRLAALFHDSGKLHAKTTDQTGRDHFHGHAKHSLSTAKKFLKHYCFDNTITAKTLAIIKHHHHTFNPDKIAIKRFINEHGAELTADLLTFQKADNLAKSDYAKSTSIPAIEQAQSLLNEILNTKEPATLQDLALNGQDIMRLKKIPPGPEVGHHLNTLLEAVIQNPNVNNPKDLKKILDTKKAEPL